MKAQDSIQQTSVAYGVTTGILFIAYFLAMSVFGYIEHLEFSLFNVIILVFMSNYALKQAFKDSNRRLIFLEIFGLCIQLSAIAFAIMAVFLYVYLRFWNPGFMEYLSAHAPMGAYLNPAGICLFLLILGGGISVIVAFILEQYYKRKTPENGA